MEYIDSVIELHEARGQSPHLQSSAGRFAVGPWYCYCGNAIDRVYFVIQRFPCPVDKLTARATRVNPMNPCFRYVQPDLGITY